jgi:hypothetical protein
MRVTRRIMVSEVPSNPSRTSRSVQENLACAPDAQSRSLLRFARRSKQLLAETLIAQISMAFTCA